MTFQARENGLSDARRRVARVWLDRKDAGRTDLPNIYRIDGAEDRIGRVIDRVLLPWADPEPEPEPCDEPYIDDPEYV